ncbi:Uncharacterised protein [Vibrio cholerae]|nr:Uncharacterised protein [Vibrio cholerae]
MLKHSDFTVLGCAQRRWNRHDQFRLIIAIKVCYGREPNGVIGLVLP